MRKRGGIFGQNIIGDTSSDRLEQERLDTEFARRMQEHEYIPGVIDREAKMEHTPYHGPSELENVELRAKNRNLQLKLDEEKRRREVQPTGTAATAPVSTNVRYELFVPRYVSPFYESVNKNIFASELMRYAVSIYPAELDRYIGEYLAEVEFAVSNNGNLPRELMKQRIYDIAHGFVLRIRARMLPFSHLPRAPTKQKARVKKAPAKKPAAKKAAKRKPRK